MVSIAQSYGYDARVYSFITGCQNGEESDEWEEWHVEIRW
jgi:hypothetical protein